MIAHDLRSPLHLIVAGARMLASDKDTDRDAVSGVIERAAAQLESLIDDLMLAARPAHLSTPMHREAVSAADLLGEVAVEAGADRVDYEPDAVIYGDRAALTRIVQNLVNNALRHGRPPVEVSLTTTDGSATLTVTDHGEAIDAESRAVLFDRFRTGTSVHAHTGLGLHIVWRLVSAHGGSVNLAEDEPTTSFIVTLPQRPASRQGDS